MPRAFRICGWFFWDIPFHKITLERTVPYGTPCRAVSIDSTSKVPYNLMWIICVQSNKKLFLQASEELEDRQSLAVMAASGQDEVTGPDGETFIEKYTRGK